MGQGVNLFENDKRGAEDLQKLNHWRRYQATLSFGLYVATQKLFPHAKLRIEHSMSQGFYCLLDRALTERDLLRLEKKLSSIISEDLPIKKFIFSKARAINLFAKKGLKDKVMLLKNTRLKNVEVHCLQGFYDIYPVPPFESTGKIGPFGLKNFPPGFIILFPHWQDLTKLPRFEPQSRLARIFYEYLEWVKILGVSDVGGLNQAIRDGRGPEIIKIAEALHEKKIVNIAERITNEKRKIVLVAGPSSAGKTTFTKRLAIQLLVNGLRPLIISTDNYFLPRRKTPKDEFGRPDFESIRAVDIPLLNQDMLKIINGKKVVLPKFEFRTGRRSRGSEVILPPNGVILAEGIHCLNEALTYKIPVFMKFKIYISALTQLNIDDHNRVSTTDTRMMRRIVRDTYFRGYSVRGVLNRWPSVRSGEEKNIYPFQEQADEMFNSSLIYEPAVLKKYCVPIIKKVRKENPEYEEARRLLDFFNLFYDLNDRDVPSNSILREFIGGSSFVY